MCKKKIYYIEITGESHGYTIKSLTNEEYNLIKDIFEDCESEYISAHVQELPDIDLLYVKYNISQLSNPTMIDIQHCLYSSNEELKSFRNTFALEVISYMLLEKYKQENNTCAK